jgi:hypothetical protein
MTLPSTNSNTALSLFIFNVSGALCYYAFVVSNQLFESIGSLKYGVVQFTNKHTFKFYNNKVKPITKCYFFGDSNNPQLIL